MIKRITEKTERAKCDDAERTHAYGANSRHRQNIIKNSTGRELTMKLKRNCTSNEKRSDSSCRQQFVAAVASSSASAAITTQLQEEAVGRKQD